jgi:hypothetical protein
MIQRRSLRRELSIVGASLVTGLVTLSASNAPADSCTDAARAYTCCQVSDIKADLLFKTCIQDRIDVLTSSSKTEKGEPPSAINSLTCHDIAGKFATKFEIVSLSELTYLEACMDADIGYRRQIK